MRPAPRIWIVASTVIALGLSSRPADAAFTFKAISPVNTPANAAAGEAQLFLTVEQVGANAQFCLHVVGTIPMSIQQIYIDDVDGAPLLNIGGLAANPFIESPPQVDFQVGANPNNLPNQGNAVPPFDSDYAFSSVNPSGGIDSGVNPGEMVCIIIPPTTSFAAVLAAVQNGTLRVGLHVQSIGTNLNSESFVNTTTEQPIPNPVPAPAGLILLASAVPMLALRRAFRRKLNVA